MFDSSPSGTSSRNSVTESAFDGCVLNFGPHYNTYHVTVQVDSEQQDRAREGNSSKKDSSSQGPRRPKKGRKSSKGTYVAYRACVANL